MNNGNEMYRLRMLYKFAPQFRNDKIKLECSIDRFIAKTKHISQNREKYTSFTCLKRNNSN